MEGVEDGLPATKEDLLKKAREDIENGYAQLEEHDLDAVTRSFARSKQDCDVNLSHRQISELPEELIDIIKDGVTRLALHRNHLKGLSGLTLRIPECTKLKYLALRNNEIREFPKAILNLPWLEVLDLKCNKLEVLPEDLDRLENLRAFAISRNRVLRLPTCIARMGTLKSISAWKNPIVFPPMDQWTLEKDEEDRKPSRTNDDDTARSTEETIKLKRYLLDYLNKEKIRKDGTDTEQSEGNVEVTPRPARRKVSGRLPIKPSVSGFEYIPSSIPASPMLPKPPVPAKSYARLGNVPLSAATLRPGVAPLVNGNERNRSNSESQMSTSVKEKRMGYVTTRKQQFQEKLLDSKRFNRLSHNRGLSHGSALQQGAAAAMTDSSSPNSPTDGDQFRPGFVNRLSSLPEGKRKSRIPDPTTDFARGLLYSLNQVAGPIQTLLTVLERNSSGEEQTRYNNLMRQSLNALHFVQLLDQKIISLERSSEDAEEGDRRKSQNALHTSCETCLATFTHLVLALRDHARDLVLQGSQQYVRSLMHLLYASLIEIRIACKKLGDVQFRPAATQPYATLEQELRESPESDRPATSLRHREASSPLTVQNRSNTRPAFHSASQASLSTISRSTSNASFGVTSPPTMGSFASYPASVLPTINTATNGNAEEVDEELLFRKIYSRLESACDIALKSLPACVDSLVQYQHSADQRGRNAEVHGYAAAYDRCKVALETADDLQKRLLATSIDDQNARSNLQFWQICTAFTRAYIVFVGQVKHLVKNGLSCDEVKTQMRPLQRIVKDVSRAIIKSPWAPLAVQPGQKPISPPTQNRDRAINGHVDNKLSHQFRNAPQHTGQPSLTLQIRSPAPLASPLDPTSAVSTVSSGGLASGMVTPLPATPMSAALGPAALATVPAIAELPLAVNGTYLTTTNGIHPIPGLERARSVSQRR